jgi:tetratricopeptide (TPR) repeat protein
MTGQSRTTFGQRGSFPPGGGQPATRTWLWPIAVVLVLSFAGFVIMKLCLGNTKFYYRTSFSGPSTFSQQLDSCSGKANASADQIISACTALLDSGRGNDKGRSEATYNRGNAYASIGEFDRAIADYDRALQLNPTMATAFDNRGRAYSQKNQFERAVADYNEAIRLNPNSAIALHNRCWAHIAVGNIGDALSDCNESLRIRPQDAGTLSTRGLVYLRAGAFDKAILDYDAALQNDPKMAGLKLAAVLYGRGVAKQKLNQPGANDDIGAAKALIGDIAEKFAPYNVQ